MSLPRFQWTFMWRPWTSLLRWFRAISSRIIGTTSWLLGNRDPPILSEEEKRARFDKLSEKWIADQKAKDPNPNHVYDAIYGKGDLVGGGLSGLVERLPSGNVVKSPWPGWRDSSSRRDITLEHTIYQMLGPHPCLVPIVAWDSEECSLTMEYMSNGTLKDYLLANNDTVDTTQRVKWAQAAAEGLQLLHEHEIIHSDINPSNFLLDANLGLKICDFSSASLRGAAATGCSGARFAWPRMDLNKPQVQEDIFGLGSTIYFIMAGHHPYPELSSGEVKASYEAEKFPDVTSVIHGSTIHKCWTAEFDSIQNVRRSMDESTSYKQATPPFPALDVS